jgi:hypothetical protein
MKRHGFTNNVTTRSMSARLLLFALGAVSSTCALAQGSFQDLLKKQFQPPTAAAPATQSGQTEAGQTQSAAPTTAPGPGAPTTPAPAAGSELQMPANAAQLFHKKSATGAELAFVLQSLATAAHHRQSRSFFSVASPPNPAASPGFTQILMEGAYTKWIESKEASGPGKSYSDRSLDHFLDGMLQDKTGLQTNHVDLPKDGETMTPAQQERLLILGAMVIGARIANQTLHQAHENFTIISTQYEDLLDRRQKAAGLLADVMERRRQALAAKNELEARKLSAGLSDDDLKFLDSFGSSISVATFDDDVGLQNLALSYLRKTDPSAYADYDTKRKEFVSSSKAYLQTVGGVAAFGGFSALFIKQLVDMVHAKDYTGGLAALSLIRAFANEVEPLMKGSSDALYDGLVTAPKNAHRTYRLEHAGTLTDIDHASQVFQSLASTGDKQLFDDAVFRDSVPGFISHVYQCDAEDAGNLLDTAIPETQRLQFAQDYLDWHQQGAFSFGDALYDEAATPGGKRLAEPLLNRDQRKRGDAAAIGQIQSQTVAKDDSWSDIQLMRLIVANSEGTRAQMQLGSSIVRLVPSMTTIYAYESYTDVCIKTASQPPAHASSEQRTPHVRTKKPS